MNLMLYEYYMDRYLDHIENEIERQKTLAFANLASFVSDSKSLDVISRIIASACLEDNPDAVKIIHKLNIDKLELFSLVENQELFKNQYEKEMNWASESDAYNNNYLFGG